MSRMIEDLLDLARGRLAGGIQLVLETTDLGAVVSRVVRETQAARPDRFTAPERVLDRAEIAKNAVLHTLGESLECLRPLQRIRYLARCLWASRGGCASLDVRWWGRRLHVLIRSTDDLVHAAEACSQRLDFS